MLQHRAIPSTRPWRSIRSASRLSQSQTDVKTPSDSAESLKVRRPGFSILSRLSDKTQSKTNRDSDTEQKYPTKRAEVAGTALNTPRTRATSFISTRSAQKRDRAAEKWFTGVRELDISMGQPDSPRSLPRKKRLGFEYPKQHEIRPKTDLNALFSPSATRPATPSRVQTKRELGGDYTSYIPDEYADPSQHPIAYARLILGRNKHISLSAQTDALSIIEEAIQGKH